MCNKFLKSFVKIKQVGHGSCMMENTIESLVLILFDNLILNIALKC